MMKQITYKKRAAIHGLSMAVFLGACLGVQGDDKNVSVGASVNTDWADRNASLNAERDNNSKLSRSDANFVKEAATSGLMEVHMGQMAKDRGANPEVKRFGEMLVKDHGKANEKLTSIATQKGMNLAKDMDPKHGSMMREFENKSGADFDKTFAQHAVKHHRKDVAKFEKATKDLNDTELRAFATETLPVLRAHLEQAQRMARTLGVDVTVSDASEYGQDASATANAGAPGVSVESRTSSGNRIDADVDAKANVDADASIDKDRGSVDADASINTNPNDGKTLGVETREGDNKVLGLNTSKNDGKILGVVPAPGGNNAEASADLDVDRDSKSVEVKADSDIDIDADKPRASVDADVDVDTDKGDGKTLGVETQAGDNRTLGVETEKGDGRVLGIETRPGDGRTLGLNTSKDDGKLLGIFPAPGRNSAEADVDVDVDENKGVSVDANADLDRNSSVGAPAGADSGAKVEASADADLKAKTMSYNDLPKAVQESVRSHGGSANIKNAKKHQMNGKTAYKVQIQKDGRDQTLHIAEDGTIIKDNSK